MWQTNNFSDLQILTKRVVERFLAWVILKGHGIELLERQVGAVRGH